MSDYSGMYVYMYVLSSHIARSRINRVRLPILLVISVAGKINSSLSPFAPENLVSRHGFGSPVPRQPAHLHIKVEFGAYGIHPESRGGVHLLSVHMMY